MSMFTPHSGDNLSTQLKNDFEEHCCTLRKAFLYILEPDLAIRRQMAVTVCSGTAAIFSGEAEAYRYRWSEESIVDHTTEEIRGCG